MIKNLKIVITLISSLSVVGCSSYDIPISPNSQINQSNTSSNVTPGISTQSIDNLFDRLDTNNDKLLSSNEWSGLGIWGVNGVSSNVDLTSAQQLTFKTFNKSKLNKTDFRDYGGSVIMSFINP